MSQAILNVVVIPKRMLTKTEAACHYQHYFDYLKPIESTPLASFNRAFVVRIRDKAAQQHGRRFANYTKAVPVNCIRLGR